MLFGINLLLWTAETTDAHFPLLEQIKQWGYDGVELPLLNTTEAALRTVGRQLDDLGLRRTAVTICPAEANPISPDPAGRRAAVAYLKQRIDWAALAGVEVLVGPIHSALGEFSGRGPTPDEWAWCVEVQREIAAYAAQANVQLSVEPLNRFETYLLTTAADANRLVAEVGAENYGYLYDSFHANIEELDIAASVTENAAGINHVHISENHRGIPGTGHVRWDDTFRALKASGYDGWLTIEAFGRALPDIAAATRIWRDLFPSEEAVGIQGLEFMKRQWEAA